MSRITPLSGFPEWLPAQRLVELRVIDQLRATFELHGFTSLETRAVEPLDQLLRKGETSQEIYLLRRLQAETADAGDETLGLHFDLTVPFARYVGENAGKLVFPFRRYQIQKAWRGERPQVGRYREFTQADIDVIDRDTLAAHYEAEIPLVVGEALDRLPTPPITILVNNRRLCEGYYRGLGLADPEAALRAIDKIDKIGPAAVAELLTETAGANDSQAKACLALAEIETADLSFVDAVRALGVADPLLDRGLAELVALMETAREYRPNRVVASLKIARALNYYTGMVYESRMAGFERSGSVCSGGRYDNLATSGADKYPGVGISVGVSRMLGILFGADAVAASRPVPTCVLIALAEEASRPGANRIAAALRERGIPTEVSPSAVKYGRQIRFAERRGIPFVWFPAADGADEVKDIRSGEQVAADPATWVPPVADLHPAITVR